MLLDCSELQEQQFVFVKKTPDFELDDKQLRNVYRKIARMKELKSKVNNEKTR